MFNKRLIVSLSIFFIFMIYTSSVKHKTRNLEKKINNLNSEIGVLKKQLKDAKTDYVFLSSPEQLKKYLITLNINDFSIYDASRIFFSTDQFTILSSKEWKLITIIFPPDFTNLVASIRPFINSENSLLTKILKA